MVRSLPAAIRHPFLLVCFDQRAIQIHLVVAVLTGDKAREHDFR
jgi:hypothetical protein